MPKNIALFIDGTWNDTDKKGETNVHKLYKATLDYSNQCSVNNGIPQTRDKKEQVVCYIEGVGTGGVLDRILGGATGFGTKNKIKKAYDFLASNYQTGDNIYLFGFSRGAFAARSLAAFVGVVGPTLAEVSEEKIAQAYLLYVKATEVESYIGALRDEWGNGQVPAEMYPIPIHFIGVWDTVRMLGLQYKDLNITHSWTQHHDHPRLPSHITHARHALALHELRPEFEPTLWEDWDEKKQSLEQFWFPGAHSDVGGGYIKTELSDIALRWMACESAKNDGLKLNLDKLPPVPAQPRRIHYQSTMLRRHHPRKIFFSDWKSKSDKKIMKSFFMHKAARARLLNSLDPSQRKYWQEWDAQPEPKAILVPYDDKDKYGLLLTQVDKLTLSFYSALLREQEAISQGLENVTLESVAGRGEEVKKFFESEAIENADVGLLEKALPLFILFGGDCSSYNQRIENVTERVCQEANQIDGESHLNMLDSWLGRVASWSGKLKSIKQCLDKVPGGEVMLKSVNGSIERCNQQEASIRQSYLRARRRMGPDLRL